jgi:hypothetical protein
MGYDINRTIESARYIGMVYATSDIYDVLNEALDMKINRNISGKDKGLAMHGFYCAMRFLVLIIKGNNYPQIMRWIITQGTDTGKGDTDTNAAITGAYVGAYCRFDSLMLDVITENNWNILMNQQVK